MKPSDYIAIVGVVATLFGALLTWLVMRRQIVLKKLTYALTIAPLLLKRDAELSRDLKVLYQGEELPEPALLSIDITNVGNSAIENAKLIVQLPDATYLIPGYIQDVPVGYDLLWDIKRTDAEECEIYFQHINPGQTARIRLLMDAVPSGEPVVSCPIPNVTVVQSSRSDIGTVAMVVLRLLEPGVLRALNQH